MTIKAVMTRARRLALGGVALLTAAGLVSAAATGRKPNHLLGEKSPYLIQHAYNPVDWHPWGEESFAKAKRENKPIFLSIGYSTCHWCHVMERESFSNPKIAAVMNVSFVSIKVDREERPDVDKVYMTAATGAGWGGGWPLNLWLTPDLKPFFGGTYFPPDSRGGRPGLAQLSERIAELWKSKRDGLQTDADRLGRALEKYTKVEGRGGPLDPAALESGFKAFVKSYEPSRGGFGGAPKFPMPANLDFLLRYHARTKAETALEMSVRTLREMAKGGIHDHVGGGFHRYSTDERWHIPHFEKIVFSARPALVAGSAAGPDRLQIGSVAHIQEDNAVRVNGRPLRVDEHPAQSRLARDEFRLLLSSLRDFLLQAREVVDVPGVRSCQSGGESGQHLGVPEQGLPAFLQGLSRLHGRVYLHVEERGLSLSAHRAHAPVMTPGEPAIYDDGAGQPRRQIRIMHPADASVDLGRHGDGRGAEVRRRRGAARRSKDENGGGEYESRLHVRTSLRHAFSIAANGQGAEKRKSRPSPEKYPCFHQRAEGHLVICYITIMSLSPAFGAALARTRARAGHKSPYAFHKARGRGLEVAYVNYLRLEAGESLPKPVTLRRLLSALGHEPGTVEAVELVRAYVRAHLASDELYACLDASPARRDRAPENVRLSEDASRGTREGRTAHLTPAQYRVIAADADAYVCNAILVNSETWVPLSELAVEAGLSAPRTKQAMRKLITGELAELTARGARSRFWNKYLAGAPRSAEFASIQAKFDAHRACWAESRGRGVHRAYLLVRAREADLKRYYAHLDETVYMSSMYGDSDRAEGGAMHLVEARVTRLG
ncbi:MAG: thioredoxin domain-containing protein [Elusimicrobia bacterium]|nr:thioredoxin domain-containing protein [Elusimicrobiota bacterium]